ncbi:membrane progestin receptor beta [Oncorhynchus mykiss]|uniref:Putative membrane progestin receptor beta n=1 Tax=Oncorhynchus mykiss TaxID=8022 RepID=Q3HW38_ONCMY|nr:membrane progestin receptor beta [Oncorhynchus mykiss]ABA39295.1 putative membrane progestin receptor beta [Oncorhynchus mykiss]
MTSGALGRLSTLTLSVKQLSRLPHLSDVLPSSLPSLPSPSPTVPVSCVPTLFQEPYILSGYRPVGQDWRCYILSLFQRHNESLNVWTHLLAGPLVLLRVWAYGLSLDSASLPLCLYILSALTYLCCSVAAHLLQSHSELAHYTLFFLDYVGVSVYQYGCSLAHYFYCSEPAWRESPVGFWFLPGAALLGWLSCANCCFAKSRYRRPYPLRRKICQLIPTSMAYFLDISPVAHRLATVPWGQDPALPLHALQMAAFLLAAFFFSCPVPERFFPGHCDIMGQGHQIFHLFLSLCTLCQLEALFPKTMAVGGRYSACNLYGERQLWFAGVSFLALALCSTLTAVVMRRHVQRRLEKSETVKQ